MGFDGLHVVHGARVAWVRFADVARIGADGGIPVVERADGERWRPAWETVDASVVEAIHARLVRAHTLGVEHGRAPELPAARAGRGEGAYRTAEHDEGSEREELRAVLESPLSEDASRLEAARRLVASSDPIEGERVRLVSLACARPELAAELQAIARGR